MDQSHRHDALGQTTSPVISSMRAASAVSSVFPSVPRNVLILQKFRPLSTRTAACTVHLLRETLKQVIKKRCSHESK